MDVAARFLFGLFITLFASCESACVDEEVCTSRVETASVSLGDALLQTKRTSSDSLVMHSADRRSQRIQQHGVQEPLLPEDRSMATTWQCVGDDHNRSCLFKNLYYGKTDTGNNDFMMFIQPDQDLQGMAVFRSNKYDPPWQPRTQIFNSSQDMIDHVASKAVVDEPGLSVHFSPLFHHNIGHALFDGLYPAYMALIKLGLEEKNFRPIPLIPDNCFDASDPLSQEKMPLMAGDIIEAYLPDPRYNKTLRPSKVKVLYVTDSDSTLPAGSDANLCTFELGLDSSATDMGSLTVQGGHEGRAECCEACGKAFGCTRAVMFGDVCYLKGTCTETDSTCDHPREERLMCRVHEELRSKAELSVQQIYYDESHEPVTIPMQWVVGRVRRRCMSEGIYETFGKSSDMLRSYEMDQDIRSNPNVLFHFEEIAIGSGGAGNMIQDDSGAIGGSGMPHNAMARFRNRMLEAYGLPANDNQSRDPQKPLDVIVISNKRFDDADKASIESSLQSFRLSSNATAELLDWSLDFQPEHRFRDHLQRVQEADVYVSSVGTALQYVPFMKDQRVFINLGCLWQSNGQQFPTFMEQQLAGGGTPYLRTLYADPGEVLRRNSLGDIGEGGFRAMVNGTVLLKALQEAYHLVQEGFPTPVPIVENLSVEGKVLLDLCEQDPITCQSMQTDRNGGPDNRLTDCGAWLWPDAIVYEVGPWRSQCNLNRGLLRELRKNYGLFSYGAPEM